MARRTRSDRPARGEPVRGEARRRDSLDAAAETVLLGRLAEARVALLQAAARVPAVQAACLRSWEPWIDTGRVTRSARRSLLFGREHPGQLRERLRILRDRVRGSARRRARARDAAALASAFAGLPLRPAWLLAQIGRAPDTPDLTLARSVATDWLAARNALAEALHGFVVMLARRAPLWHVPLEDRIQTGALAMTRAIEGFDAARGTRLSSYLGPVIERTMHRLGSPMPRKAALPSRGIATVRLAEPRAHHGIILVTIDSLAHDGPDSLANRLVDLETPTPEDLPS